MYDSKEISKRALLRAEEIKGEKIRRRRTITSGLCGLGVMAVAFAIMVMPGVFSPGIIIDDDPVPLAAFLLPDENALPYPAGGMQNYPVFSVPGYDSVTVPADVAEVSVALFNPEDNTCWLTFEIVLCGTEETETLYESSLVAPSMFIENVTLSRPLDRGEHAVSLIIRAYELDSLAPMGSATVDISVIAE